MVANVRLQFPITFSVVCTLALVVLTAVFAYATQSLKETLIFFLAGAAAAGQITASFYTARTLAATLAIRSSDQSDQARVYAMTFGSRWNDPAMFHVRDVLREILDHAGSHDELIKVIDGKRTNVIHIINFLEEMATAIENKMVDEELMKTQFSAVVIMTWRKCIPWIDTHRRQRNDNDLWEDLERIYDRWK